MLATKEDIIAKTHDNYEADIIIAQAKTFGYEIKVGSNHGLFASCNHCGKRLQFHTYGNGNLSERMVLHASRHLPKVDYLE